MKIIKFFLVFSILFLCGTAIYAQAVDIDFDTATYEQIHLWVIGVVTYIWGLITKFVPTLKETPIPTAIMVFAGGLATVLLATSQGFGAVVENLMAVLSTMGVYDLLKSLTSKRGA